jgi:hypothetical protein
VLLTVHRVWLNYDPARPFAHWLVTLGGGARSTRSGAAGAPRCSRSRTRRPMKALPIPRRTRTGTRNGVTGLDFLPWCRRGPRRNRACRRRACGASSYGWWNPPSLAIA